MDIFLTGGGGFLGQHLTHSLLNDGYKVTIFDNFSNSSKKELSSKKNKNLKIISGDIRNKKKLDDSIKNSQTVIHLAAKIDVNESIHFPLKTNEVNVTGTLNLLESCVKNKIKNIISASSAAIYGNSPSKILRENSLKIPISPYGISKLAMEYYLQSYSNTFGLNCISLRFFNIYGPNQPLEYGGVITKFIHNLISGKPIIINGNGKITRDFVHVEDVVQSIKKSILNIDKKRGNSYNIASGKSTSLNDLISLLSKYSNINFKVIHKSKKPGDIINSKASIFLAKKELNYSPKIKINQGIKKLIDLKFSEKN
jgi:nucleoside-diphosphate-sugar epimerase